MKQKIINLLGVCYVAFALIMASNGSIAAINSARASEQAANSMGRKDNGGDGYSERLPRFEGRGISYQTRPNTDTEETEDVSNGWIDIRKLNNIDKQLKEFKSNCAIVWTAKWCRACKRMHPIVEELQKEGYIVYLLDYDADQALAKYMDVKKLPTTIIYTDHKEVSRYIGVVSVDEVKKNLKKNKEADYVVW